VDVERRATWLEVFLDLVFVGAIAEVGLTLTRDPTAAGFARYLVLFLPVFWAWAGFTFYATRFDTDDLVYRLLTLLGMFAVAALASAVPDALHGGQRRFVLAYVAVRIILILLYVRAYRHVEVARPLSRWFIFMFSVAVVLWLVSLAVPSPWRYVLWGLALAFEYVAPIRAWRLMIGSPVHPAHIPERFGLLVIIVLGEAVIAVVLGTATVSWTASLSAAAFGGFVAAASIWWLYFGFLDTSAAVTRNVLAGMTFVYSHYFVAAGIAAFGVGVRLDILSAESGPRYDRSGWIAATGVAICMAGLAAVQLATPPTLFDVDVALRIATAIVAGALAGLSSELSPVLVLWLLAAALVAQVVFEVARHELHAMRLPRML
jgi:low temperature requirement protein LtrA